MQARADLAEPEGDGSNIYDVHGGSIESNSVLLINDHGSLRACVTQRSFRV